MHGDVVHLVCCPDSSTNTLPHSQIEPWTFMLRSQCVVHCWGMVPFVLVISFLMLNEVIYLKCGLKLLGCACVIPRPATTMR